MQSTLYWHNLKSEAACRKQTRDPICQEPSRLFDSCCSEEALARGSQLQSQSVVAESAVHLQTTRAMGGSHVEAQRSQTDGRDGGTADYYMSIQYFTKHVSQKTVVRPGNMMTDVTVARALVMLSSVLMASFVVLVAIVVLLWNRKHRKGMGKRSLSNDTIMAL